MREDYREFAGEVVRDLRTRAQMLVIQEINEPIQHILRWWAILLSVLAWEMLDSVVLLLKQKKMRAAAALTRPLIEYAIRMRYYGIDAEAISISWDNSNKLGPPPVWDTVAFKDYSNAEPKMFHNMKLSHFAHDFSDLDPDEIALLQEILSAEPALRTQRWATMLKVAIREDNELRDLVDAEFGIRCGYLHGDQIAAWDVLVQQTEADESPRFESFYTERRLIADSLYFSLLLMQAIDCTMKRDFATRVHQRRFNETFY